MAQARWLAVAPLLPVLAGCATAGPLAAGESISISQRHDYAICTGLCPNYDLTVRADGLVDVQQVRLDEHPASERYRVPPAQAAPFARILQAYRPHGVKGTPICDHTGFEARGMTLDVVEVQITWSAPTGDRLYSCHDPEVRDAIRRALLQVGLSAGAFPIAPDERGGARED
jgi:hypothetical protein